MKLHEFGINTEIKTRSETCEKHGELISRNLFGNIWSGCPACAEDRQAAEQQEADETAAIARLNAWQKKLGDACIPERFHNRTLDKYIARTEGQQHALNFSREYAENFSQVLETGLSAVFCGKPGTGKTHLAVGVGLHAMAHGKLVLFSTVQRMIRRVKDSWRNNVTESESDVIGLLVQPDLLIIDEIGVQFGSDFERNLMFDILNERYEKRRPSLLISNLTPREVKAFLGERVYDRLREDGGVCIPFDWDSYRKSVTVLEQRV